MLKAKIKHIRRSSDGTHCIGWALGIVDKWPEEFYITAKLCGLFNLTPEDIGRTIHIFEVEEVRPKHRLRRVSKMHVPDPTEEDIDGDGTFEIVPCTTPFGYPESPIGSEYEPIGVTNPRIPNPHIIREACIQMRVLLTERQTLKVRSQLEAIEREVKI